MKLIPSLEFVFRQRKPLHLPLKCIHFWAGMHQLFPASDGHTRQPGLRMRPRIPGRWNWWGHFKPTGCNYPNWNEARGISGGPSHLPGKRITRYFTRASGQHLHCRSHFKGRHFKKKKDARKAIPGIKITSLPWGINHMTALRSSVLSRLGRKEMFMDGEHTYFYISSS